MHFNFVWGPRAGIIINVLINKSLMVNGAWLMAHGSRLMAHGSWPRGAGPALVPEGAPGPDPGGPGAPSGPKAGPAPLGHEP